MSSDKTLFEVAHEADDLFMQLRHAKQKIEALEGEVAALVTRCESGEFLARQNAVMYDDACIRAEAAEAEVATLTKQNRQLSGLMCLVCGRDEPCPETPEACTFDPDPIEAARGFQKQWRAAEARAERLQEALERIANHWANQYDHPNKNWPMYEGPYGIGVTDGHRACTAVARKALLEDDKQ